MYRVTFSRRIRGLILFSGSAIAFTGVPGQVSGSEAAAEEQPAAGPVARTVGRTPSQGLRPIGAPSPVDAYTRPQSSASGQGSAGPQTGAGSQEFSGSQGFSGLLSSPGSSVAVDPDHAHPVPQPVLPPPAALRSSANPGGEIVQTAYMQGGGFAMPPSGATAPPITANGDAGANGSAGARPAPAVTGGSGLQAPPLSGGPSAAPPATSNTPLPGGLQPVPSTAPLTAPPSAGPQSSPLTASPSDAAPVPQPQLGSRWATADNCNLVSHPSGYRAEFLPCGPAPVMPMTYAAPPAVVVPPTIMPGAAPPAYIPATVGHRPLFTLGQENYNVQLGQGIIGQPTAYVPGQHFRNFIRYLSP